MDRTQLDVLAEYPVKALQKIGTDKTVVSLLTNDPNIDMSSDEADEIFDKYLFDYRFVDGTTEEAEAYICCEVDMPRKPTVTMKSLKVYVTVICHKSFMKIDTSKFTGMIGNRRENIVRYVDKLLNGSEIFGIGKLSLETALIVPAPAGFTARELTYSISEFRETTRGI